MLINLFNALVKKYLSKKITKINYIIPKKKSSFIVLPSHNLQMYMLLQTCSLPLHIFTGFDTKSPKIIQILQQFIHHQKCMGLSRKRRDVPPTYIPQLVPCLKYRQYELMSGMSKMHF
jgi:hypothetical protein